jgi:hypothetical protein
MLSSLTSPVSYKASFAASIAVMYSALVVDMATVEWIIDIQQMGRPARVNTEPVVDLLSSKFLA